jgi:hypothetical protein
MEDDFFPSGPPEDNNIAITASFQQLIAAESTENILNVPQ